MPELLSSHTYILEKARSSIEEMAGLKLALLGVVFLVAVLSPVCVHSRPMRGKFTDIIYSPNASDIARVREG